MCVCVCKKNVGEGMQLLEIEEQGTDFCFRKFEFNTTYNAYSNKLSLKYYIIILGGMVL